MSFVSFDSFSDKGGFIESKYSSIAQRINLGIDFLHLLPKLPQQTVNFINCLLFLHRLFPSFFICSGHFFKFLHIVR